MTNEVKSHQCVTCGRSFKLSGDLNRHVMIHTGEKPFKCSFCPEKFRLKSAMMTHAMRHHTGDRPHKCNLRAAGYVTPELRYHVMTHTGERPYKCSQRGKAFIAHSNLRAHTKMHLTEKPYPCDLCSTSFKRSQNLREHERKQHRGVFQNPPHKRDPVRLPCAVCGKSFLRSGRLSVHHRKHTGEKPHQCEICSRRFRQMTRLRKHFMICMRNGGHQSRFTVVENF